MPKPQDLGLRWADTKGDDEYPLDIPAVVFPVGALVRSGKLIIYAGAGDKYVVMLSCCVEKLVDYLWEHCPPMV